MLYKTNMLLLMACLTTACDSHKGGLSLFPLDHYSQTLSDWIQPNGTENNKPLLSADLQQKRFATFYKHVFGSSSPWSENYVNKILHHAKPDDLNTLERNLIIQLSNQNKSKNFIGYGENFRAHTPDWMNNIKNNIQSSQFDSLRYNRNNRGIAIDNLPLRVLPTDDVHFYSYTIAGQGYPFDNLQMSALWAGTPVYILGETRDHAWEMVITPDTIAWVKSKGIAHTHAAFVKQWQQAATKHLAAITHTQTPIIDQKGQYHFSAYVGSVFPAEETHTNYSILFPVLNNHEQAESRVATLPKDDAQMIPSPATQNNFSKIISTLIGRPYGWGNLYFYNDCSSELKNLFTPFGIWLPRHSSDQVSMGNLVDKTSSSTKQRLTYLMEHGHRFMTLVYVGGHIILYIGNYPNPNDKTHSLMAMTYQNVWGLSPHPATRRAVIGQSVLFPMLLSYPEDTNLVSLAGKSTFQVSFLDEPSTDLNKIEIIDLRSLMMP